jgi:hypothetical protein
MTAGNVYITTATAGKNDSNLPVLPERTTVEAYYQ